MSYGPSRRTVKGQNAKQVEMWRRAAELNKVSLYIHCTEERLIETRAIVTEHGVNEKRCRQFVRVCHRSLGVATHMPEVRFYLLARFAFPLIY